MDEKYFYTNAVFEVTYPCRFKKIQKFSKNCLFSLLEKGRKENQSCSHCFVMPLKSSILTTSKIDSHLSYKQDAR